MKILLDANVLLDVLLDREPFAEASSRVWAAAEGRAAQALIPAHALTTVHYVLRRAKGARAAREMVDGLLELFRIAAVDEAAVKRACALDFADFEDAVSAAAAEAAGCELVVTRNTRDFRRSPVPAVDPLVAAARLEAGPDRVSERRAPYGRPRGQRRRPRRAASPPA